MQRSNLSRDEAEAILKTQTSRQKRLAAANTIIENHGKLTELNGPVELLHQKILEIQKARLSSS
jgi:dephospho-CoA kinase